MYKWQEWSTSFKLVACPENELVGCVCALLFIFCLLSSTLKSIYLLKVVLGYLTCITDNTAIKVKGTGEDRRENDEHNLNLID